MKYIALITETVNEGIGKYFLNTIYYLLDRQTKRWYGKAIIPLDYFPPQVDRFNAYAIHDQHVKPIYKSLYPSNGAQPDFHDLPSFAAFNEFPSLKNINHLSTTCEEAIRNPIKEDK